MGIERWIRHRCSRFRRCRRRRFLTANQPAQLCATKRTKLAPIFTFIIDFESILLPPKHDVHSFNYLLIFYLGVRALSMAANPRTGQKELIADVMHTYTVSRYH